MIKLKPFAACNGRFRSRKSSAIRTLVAETLVLAKTHGYVEKIEHELEAELERDISDPPQEKLKRWRRGGDQIFKSKHVLLTVVILCIVDCALVLGELALDLYKVKATLEQTDSITKNTKAFLHNMEGIYPHIQHKRPYEVFSLLLRSDIVWAEGNMTSTNTSTYVGSRCRTAVGGMDPSGSTPVIPTDGEERPNATMTFYPEPEIQEFYDLEIVGSIAHIFHYCSITILLVILFETILKAICAGKDFFHRKLEVFDAFVVLISFILDLSFIVFLPDIDTKDFVFILAILLPWRVIRVVNSLVVSVKDHEHFRLKLVYKRKKKIQGNLRDTEAMLQRYIGQVTTLHRLCIIEGVDEWKIDHCLRAEESAPTTPSKKKFKFKLDDSLFPMSGTTRAPRCSLPTLELHGLKLPSNGAVSKSRISLPSVANTIKDHLKKTSRRASLAAVEMCNLKTPLKDLRKRKSATDNLCTMQEEEFTEPKDRKCDSLSSSRGSFLTETEDDLSETAMSSSQYSLRTYPRGKSLSRASTCSIESDDIGKLNEIQQSAKRRLSESNMDKRRLTYGMADVICFKDARGKTYTKPYVTGDKYYNQEDYAQSSDDDTRISAKLDCLNDSIEMTDNEIYTTDGDDDVDDVIIIKVPTYDSINEENLEGNMHEPQEESSQYSQVNIEQNTRQSAQKLKGNKSEINSETPSCDNSTRQVDGMNNKVKPTVSNARVRCVDETIKSSRETPIRTVYGINFAKQESITEEDEEPIQLHQQGQDRNSQSSIVSNNGQCRVENVDEDKPKPVNNEYTPRLANGINDMEKSLICRTRVSDDLDNIVEPADVIRPRTVIEKRKDNITIEYEIKDSNTKK